MCYPGLIGIFSVSLISPQNSWFCIIVIVPYAGLMFPLSVGKGKKTLMAFYWTGAVSCCSFGTLLVLFHAQKIAQNALIMTMIGTLLVNLRLMFIAYYSGKRR